MKTLFATLALAALAAVPATHAELPLPTDVPYCITTECGSVAPSSCDVQDATPAPLLHPVWGYDDDCRAEVETSCLGGASGSTDRSLLFVDVSLARCSGPDWS